MIKAAGTAGKKCLWGPGPHGRKVRWCLVDMLLSVPLAPFWALHPLQHHTGHLQNSTYGQHGPVFPQSPLENRTQNLTQAEPVRVLSLDFRSCSGKGQAASLPLAEAKRHNAQEDGSWFRPKGDTKSQKQWKWSRQPQSRDKTRRALNILVCASEIQFISLPFQWFSHCNTYLNSTNPFPYLLVWI